MLFSLLCFFIFLREECGVVSDLLVSLHVRYFIPLCAFVCSAVVGTRDHDNLKVILLPHGPGGDFNLLVGTAGIFAALLLKIRFLASVHLRVCLCCVIIHKLFLRLSDLCCAIEIVSSDDVTTPSPSSSIASFSRGVSFMRRSWRRLAGDSRRDSVDAAVFRSLDDTVTACDGSHAMSSAECACMPSEAVSNKYVRRVATVPTRQRTTAHLKQRWVVRVCADGYALHNR
ncbi:hypothetical protein ANCDUO_07387 [Ancylostoma duodenale]|uniref:Uncharacterized protein n=1 Tax=Ancylostoma duodenale TaxID=51022 RepID=A0A0C2GYY3_9BILA|nr:hypothetical protein ANCDUO_07387 [Ancylostoma duodenale]